MSAQSDYIPTERAALVAWWLAKGEQLTTRQVAERLEMTVMGAWYMLQKLCRVLPICFDQGSGAGYWYSIEHYCPKTQLE